MTAQADADDGSYGALNGADGPSSGGGGGAKPNGSHSVSPSRPAAASSRTTMGLCLVNVVFGAAFSLIAPFLPSQALRSGVPQWVVGVIFAAFSVTMLLAAPVSAQAVATYGPRNTIVAGMGVMTAGVCGMGVLQALRGDAFIVVAVALRIVQGLGAALAETGSFHVVSTFYGDRMGTVMGLTETCMGVGTMIGPPVGGALFQLGGFYLPTTVIGGAIFLLLPLLFCWLPDADADAPADPGRAISIWQLLANPPVALLVTVIAVCYGSIAFLQPVLAPHEERTLGVTPSQIGLMLALACFMYCVLAPAAGWVSDRRGRFGTVMVGIVVLSGSLLLLAPVAHFIPVTVAVQTTALGLIGVGASLSMVPAMPGLMEAAQRVVDTTPKCSSVASTGAVSAVLSASLSVGEIVGPVVGAAIVDRYSFAAAAVVYAGIVALCGVGLVVAKLVLPRDFMAVDGDAALAAGVRVRVDAYAYVIDVSAAAAAAGGHAYS